ncbi:MAG: AmmeMemoRadiSam system protein B [Candidatus Omnitrophota bacterium]
MKTALITSLVTICQLPFAICLFPRVSMAQQVRKPAVAGPLSFYPSDTSELKGMVDSMLKQAQKTAIGGELIALIVPHAGYVYSGQIAAYAYKQLEGAGFDTAVIVGDSHRARYQGASVGDYDFLETPLGKINIDKEITKALLETKGFSFNRAADTSEHSLEVQLPFLQEALGDFKAVLVLVGDASYENAAGIADSLAKNIKGKNTILIASTDLSHYHPYNVAVALDKKTIDTILALDAKDLFERMVMGDCELCGQGAVVSVILAAKKLGADKAKLLKYANSGDVTGDKSGVVGYAAIAIYK